jgi:hypothetical protein
VRVDRIESERSVDDLARRLLEADLFQLRLEFIRIYPQV